MQVNKINISYILGSRMDISFYQKRFDYVSNIFPLYSLSQLLYVNPSVNFNGLSPDDDISFVPMETIDEINGLIRDKRVTKVSNAKGFIRFADNDLLWSKLPPCMQNGKSAIARNLINGYGCGSREFYVLRPKENNILIEYVHYLLRDKRALESAKNIFGGSAGQQRVSISYLKSIKIPLPPLEVQKEIVTLYNKAQNERIENNNKANKILESIDEYLLASLNVEIPTIKKKEVNFKLDIADVIGNRLDVSYYRDRFNLKSSTYDNKQLSDIVYLNPSVNVKHLDKDDKISFIPMENINEVYGEINENVDMTVSQMKRFTKFEEGDLLWTKISPCMQNGKTAIARNLTNGIGCGSTEFYVLRPINKDIISVDYIYCILRIHKVLEAAQSSFVGLAGQQRVPSGYIMSLSIPIPPIAKQIEISSHVVEMKNKVKQLQQKGSELIEEAQQKIEEILLM